MGESEDDTIY